jgi:hypothetical protein
MMVVMVNEKPIFLCDMCYFPMGVSVGEALYSRSDGARVYPQLVLACGGACARKAERLLTAGEVVRVRWTSFLEARNEGIVNAST